ncbi:hypothetical protein CARUB_v10025475mg [Capsella rubella]|uniref:F-box domain-containing protein n=1 Tax=Capsella rubella TaxID=81985 RepID=R0G1Q9_9BRAS|nr:hypothetical protein CARUB_v10025475mg [Capsella rubella]
MTVQIERKIKVHGLNVVFRKVHGSNKTLMSELGIFISPNRIFFFHSPPLLAIAMNHLAKPQSKKRKTNQPPPSSFLSLPDVIILNCLSRISKSYYPKLSLVSKTFRSLLLSTDLNLARFHHKTQERSFHVCLKFPDRPHPSWYTLWIDKEEKKKSTLVQVPSSYTSSAALFLVNGGSYDYAFRQAYPPSKVMLVRNKDSCIWRYAPKMTVARANPIACVFRRKIYVMGGCADDESVSWGEVFDINTQTWEPLPDPGPELRFSTMIREIQIIQGKIHVKSNESKDSIYDPNNGNWNGVEKVVVSESTCVVDYVLYSCRKNSCLWYDNRCKDWRLVKGLSSLNRTCRSGLIETVKLGGKMLLLWDKSTKPGRGISEEKHICGALIAFERRKYGQVWGKVEWSNALLTVPSSYSFLRSTVIRT